MPPLLASLANPAVCAQARDANPYSSIWRQLCRRCPSAESRDDLLGRGRRTSRGRRRAVHRWSSAPCYRCRVSDRLTLAIRGGTLDEVRVYIRTPEDAEARSHHGMTALEFAIEHLQTDVIRYLLRIGADVNGRDEGGVTPLHFAIDIECEWARYVADNEGVDYAPKATVTPILLDEGADPLIASAAGLTPLDWARRRGHAEAIAVIAAAVERRRRSPLR